MLNAEEDVLMIQASDYFLATRRKAGLFATTSCNAVNRALMEICERHHNCSMESEPFQTIKAQWQEESGVRKSLWNNLFRTAFVHLNLIQLKRGSGGTKHKLIE